MKTNKRARAGPHTQPHATQTDCRWNRRHRSASRLDEYVSAARTREPRAPSSDPWRQVRRGWLHPALSAAVRSATVPSLRRLSGTLLGAGGFEMRVCVCVSSLRSQYSSRSLRGHGLAREHEGAIPILRYQSDSFGGDYCSWALPPPTGHNNVAGGGWFPRSAMWHLVKLVESPLKVEPRRGADQIHLMSPSVPSVLSCTARCAPVVTCGCCASCTWLCCDERRASSVVRRSVEAAWCGVV